MNGQNPQSDNRKTLTQLATEMAQLLGIKANGSFQVHCRDGEPKQVKIETTVSLENERKSARS